MPDEALSLRVSRRGVSLRLLAQVIPEAILPAYTMKAADFAFNRMYKNAPWRTGFLAQSIRKEVSETSARVYPSADYAKIVEKGSGAHVILPANSSVLAFGTGMLGGVVFCKRVNHPGTKPNPFVATTATEVRDNAERLFLEAYQENIGEATQ
jgi:hypothetical protein